MTPTLMSPISTTKTPLIRSQSAKLSKLNLPSPPVYIELAKTNLQPPSPPLQAFYEKTNDDLKTVENPIKKRGKEKEIPIAPYPPQSKKQPSKIINAVALPEFDTSKVIYDESEQPLISYDEFTRLSDSDVRDICNRILSVNNNENYTKRERENINATLIAGGFKPLHLNASVKNNFNDILANKIKTRKVIK